MIDSSKTDSSESRQPPVFAPCYFDGADLRGPALIHIAAGRIAGLDHAPQRLPGEARVLQDHEMLAPGFIDVQVNGGGGVMLNDAPTLDAIGVIAAAHRRFGVTGLLPTLITDAPDRMRALAALAARAVSIPGVLGFHLEGPFLNPMRKGIHPPDSIRAPTPADVELLLSFAPHGRTLVTLAPECAGAAMIAALTQAGLRVAAGHSEATGAQMGEAIEAGLSGVTHLFNAMSQMTAREPGVVGSALARETLFAGIICDGLHVDPLSLRAAFRAMGRERLMLVTDAMSTIGSSQQSFLLNGRAITLREGRLTGPDGTLAGAHLSMIEAVRNAMSMMGARLEDALAMASHTPARFLGDASRGRVAEGAIADFVILDRRDLSVRATMIAGR